MPTATSRPDPGGGIPKISKPVEPVRSGSLRDGFALFKLQNSALELVMAPGLGAKIISLRNLRTGREWMWQPAAGLKLFPSRLGEDFSRGALGGWDECLPTIAACSWQGRALPDHGEVWTVAWEFDLEAWKQGRLKTSVRLPVSPFQFTRAIELRGNVVAVHYVLGNLSAAPQAFLWAAHPLLALHDGDRLELTDETRRLLDGDGWIETLNLADRSPACAKLYAGPLREGRAAVVNSHTGDRLTFEWDIAGGDTLGLWLTRGGWNGHHHLALEPATGAPDSLATANESKRCAVIAPGVTKHWDLQLRIEP